MKMLTLHAVLAALAVGFVVLVVRSNLDCAPKYYLRGDVIALLGLGIGYAILLAWAALDDTDLQRAVGSIASVGLAALFIATASLPVFVAPIAIAGALRLPRVRGMRWRVLVALPLAVLLTFGSLFVGALGLTPAQLRCP